MARFRSLDQLPNADKLDGVVDVDNTAAGPGIVRFSANLLAQDPVLIVGYPAPGERYFYVNTLNAIKVGDRLLYSTEAESDPATVKQELAQLSIAQRQRDKFPIDSQLWMDWDARCNTLGLRLQEFWEGQRRIKSVRRVAHVDRVNKRIDFTKPFEMGYRPRVLGGVVRIIATETDLANEVATDRLHHALRREYGSDWEHDIKALGLDLNNPDGGGR